MDHVGAAGHGRAQARRVVHVTRHELDPECAEVCCTLGPAHERAHVERLCAQRMHDPAPDEPRAARDENLHGCGKFCQ